MRLLLIRTLDAGHLYSVYARALCAALRAHGEDAEVFDYPEHSDALGARLLEGGYDGVISFSSFLGALSLDGGLSVFDAVGVKFLGWHFDHPVYASHLISNPMAGRRTVHSNRNHVRFAEAAGMGGANFVLLPGADPYHAPIKDYADREIEVFVAATWNGEPKRDWDDMEDSAAKRIVVHVVERLLADRETSLLDAFHQALGELGYGGLKLDRAVYELLHTPLNYVRHLDRLNVVKNLADSGLPLTVCGSGWEAILPDRPNVRLLPTASFEQTRRLYGNAKVSINLNAGNGGCERAINAMLAGSCVVSDFSSALSETFGPREIRFHERSGLHDVSHVVADLLESGQGEAMATRGQAKARATMLWEHRVGEVLKLLA